MATAQGSQQTRDKSGYAAARNFKKEAGFKEGSTFKQLRNFGVGCSSKSGISEFAVQVTPRERLRRAA
eukprot:10002337-Alexandrium_andersonii.AAC.1